MFAIEMYNVYFSYSKNYILRDVNLKIKEGDFVGIIGPNGSGKTTLIKLILGILKPERGKIKIFGNEIEKFKKWDLIGYVPQKFEIPRDFPATVEEILDIGAESRNDIIEKFEMDRILKRRFSELSGGEQQKVLLALALSTEPKLLILDEPTLGIDFETQIEFYNILREENKKGSTILIVSHDIGMIYEHVKTVVFVNKGICCVTQEKDEILNEIYGRSFRKFDHRERHMGGD